MTVSNAQNVTGLAQAADTASISETGQHVTSSIPGTAGNMMTSRCAPYDSAADCK